MGPEMANAPSEVHRTALKRLVAALGDVDRLTHEEYIRVIGDNIGGVPPPHVWDAAASHSDSEALAALAQAFDVTSMPLSCDCVLESRGALTVKCVLGRPCA